nr:ABC transporter permease [uncultured Lichenicoccus sp.]
MDQVVSLLAASVRFATPMLFAALGAILSEQAGVFAVGLEGMMLAGAFGAAVAASATGSDVAGLLASLAAGGLVGIVVGLVALRFRADQMVTGLAVNMLAAGSTSFLLRVLHHGSAPVIALPLINAWAIPGLAAIPLLGSLFRQPPLTLLAFAAFVPVSWFLTSTHAGLRLRGAGENPNAAYVAGHDPGRTRLVATIAGASIAGLGGAVLVLQQVGTYTDAMTGGRGFLALAAVIVGRWQPGATLVACLAFGAAEALELRVEIFGLPLSSYTVEMLPYLVAVLVLAAFGRSVRMPAALGRAYDPGQPG